MLDWILEHTCADADRIAVIGHSRLGKTALLAGGMDERFSLTGAMTPAEAARLCSARKPGSISATCTGKAPGSGSPEIFSATAAGRRSCPLTSIFLLALTVPRHLYIASASRDDWADPVSEFLSCAAVSEVYEALGFPGLVYPGAFPKEGDCFHEGASVIICGREPII